MEIKFKKPRPIWRKKSRPLNNVNENPVKCGLVWFDTTLLPSIDVLKVNQNRCELIQRLLKAFHLHKHVDLLQVKKASRSDLEVFHSEAYLDILECTSKPTFDLSTFDKDDLELYGLLDDCVPFEGLWTYLQYISGATLIACRYLIQMCKKEPAPIAIQWMGGRHHAKKDEASGFCFINDVSIGLVQLLKFFDRILCIDLDIHHGDGVEESFYFSSNVLTISFHMKEPGFFPGTGDLESIGTGKGKYHNLNVPLHEGIEDAPFVLLFDTIVTQAFDRYKPQCIVLVCGADVLKGDPLGGFNVTLHGVEACIRIVKSLETPTLVLGGGGYHWPNVTRMAAVVTSVFCNVELPLSIPIFDDQYNHRDTYYVPISNVRKDKNKEEYIQHLLNQLTFYIQQIPEP